MFFKSFQIFYVTSFKIFYSVPRYHVKLTEYDRVHFDPSTEEEKTLELQDSQQFGSTTTDILSQKQNKTANGR